MLENLCTKTVLITGASRGIGRATAELFYEHGYRVIGTYIKNEAAAQSFMFEHPGAEFIRVDVSQKSDIEDLRGYIDHLDVLVNNAGIAEQKLFSDITDENFDNMINVNLKSVFLTCKAFLPDMIKREKGSIVNVSSIWGITGASCEVHYSASKAGIIGLTKALAKEAATSGIRVNAVAPGVIDTDMNALSPTDKAAIEADTPMCRIGTAREVAEAIYFLASEKASFITGQVLTVDGGFIL